MNIVWTLNRLRSMSAAEIGHRVLERAKILSARNRLEGWARYADGTEPRPLPGLRDRALAATAADRAQIAAATKALLAGRFHALGRDWPARDPAQLFPAALWRLDPVTETLWPGPEIYAPAIEYRHEQARGDIKYAWEINRLQFLLPLAAEALLANDPSAADAVAAAIDSWHAANAPFRGIGWSSGIEVALRAISVMLALTLCADRLPAATRARAAEILRASALWIRRFPSRFSSANNHRIAELAGELLLGHALGTPRTGARRELEAELLRQILPDGVGAEQTPTYAAFTAELGLLVAVIGAAAGEPLAPAVLQRLAAFADHIRWLGHPLPALGDDDEGRALSLGPEPDYARSVAAAIAGVVGGAGIAMPPDIRGLLLGRPIEIAPEAAGSRTFPMGGLSVFAGEIGGQKAHLTFDHGPLGYLSIAAHGHADALAVTLSLDGRPVLVDPGTYLYGSGREWRDWFRSTPAHNTLNIDAQSQSIISGPFNWSAKAEARLDDSGTTPHPWWRAQHDGWQSRFGVTHQRALEIGDTAIAITDQLVPEPRDAELVFQLAPGLTAERDGTTITVFDGATALLRLDLPAEQPAEIAIGAGGDTPGSSGWVAPGFGARQPAPRITWRGTIGPGGVTSSLTPLQRAPRTRGAAKR